MADVTNELLLEVLKSVQGRLTNIDDRLGGMEVQMAALREHMRGFSSELNATHMDVANIYTRLSTLDRRVERIEGRLDMVDEATR